MICRHSAGDPDCSSYGGGGGGSYNYSNSSYTTPTVETPNAENYEITKVQVIEGNLVLEVKYPNCSKCAYEGRKVMVFLGISAATALRWKKIDPHFRATVSLETEAPSPDARFPASTVGWEDAIDYATRHGLYTKNKVK